MAQAAPSAGSTTTPAAVAATLQAPPPQVAAPAVTPSANIAPAGPSGKKSYAPRANTSNASTSPTGLSQMLSAVSNFSLSANSNLRVENFAVPNFTFAYQVIGMCDSQMAHTKRFTDANPDWHPYVSQLYFGVLVYYHTLKCQKMGNQISQDQKLFLEYLEDQFNVAHAKIPGPMVPFFQALSACSGPNDLYNNVTYGIPNNLGVTQARHYLATNEINQHIPSIIHMLDQFMRMINRLVPAGAAPNPITVASTDSHFMSILGINAAAGAANEIVLKTCNMRVDINVSLSTMQGFSSSTNLWRNVLPFSNVNNQSLYVAGNSNTQLSLEQVLGFAGPTAATRNVHYNWYREVSRVMQTYSDFFRDSASLGAINTSGIGSIYIEAYILDTNANAGMLTADALVRDVRYQAAGTLRYEIPNLTDLEIMYFTSESGLDLVAEQMGMLTAYNTLWAVNGNANTTNPGPANNIVQEGPVWQRQTERLSPTGVTPLRYYSNLISGYYHTPTAGKFGN